MTFCALRRDHVRQQNPVAEEWELGKVLFDTWRAFGTDKKVRPISPSSPRSHCLCRVIQKRRSKKRKKKDPSAPKNAGSAYQYYMKHHRPLLREQNEDITFSELGKAVGAMWKAASADEKRVSPFFGRLHDEQQGYVSY